MKYKDFLKDLTTCPFCDRKNEILKENDLAYLTYANAPYHKHHLLVIPKRHVTSFLGLNDEEDEKISNLVDYGAGILEKMKYKDYSILVRNGVLGKVGKSIPHLHYHIIPNIQIGNLKYPGGVGGEREILTKKEIEELKEDIKKVDS